MAELPNRIVDVVGKNGGEVQEMAAQGQPRGGGYKLEGGDDFKDFYGRGRTPKSPIREGDQRGREAADPPPLNSSPTACSGASRRFKPICFKASGTKTEEKRQIGVSKQWHHSSEKKLKHHNAEPHTET